MRKEYCLLLIIAFPAIFINAECKFDKELACGDCLQIGYHNDAITNKCRLPNNEECLSQNNDCSNLGNICLTLGYQKDSNTNKCVAPKDCIAEAEGCKAELIACTGLGFAKQESDNKCVCKPPKTLNTEKQCVDDKNTTDGGKANSSSNSLAVLFSLISLFAFILV